MPPDDITLNHSNKKVDQGLSDFQTGIGEAVHASLDREQLISHTRAVPVLAVISLQGSDGRVITSSNVQITKIHDILDSAMSK